MNLVESLPMEYSEAQEYQGQVTLLMRRYRKKAGEAQKIWEDYYPFFKDDSELCHLALDVLGSTSNPIRLDVRLDRLLTDSKSALISARDFMMQDFSYVVPGFCKYGKSAKIRESGRVAGSKFEYSNEASFENVVRGLEDCDLPLDIVPA